ncbi:MAG: GNAT family N-acetyltransferase [Acidimicrobiia bacterium]|nr:GNAT family N-acetyltransferase [Acidimicrobiia bacterium]
MLAIASGTNMTPTPVLPTIEVPLSGELVAEIRPVLPGDAPQFERGLSELSEESRYARFGIGIDHLTSQELRYLTNVDLVSHVAWGATIAGDAAGVGRYVMLDDGESAEVAVTVVDRFQQRGLGRALFEALTAVARRDGVETLRFEVEPSNEAVKRLVMVDAEVSESGLFRGAIPVADLPETPRDRDYLGLIDWYRAAPPRITSPGALEQPS